MQTWCFLGAWIFFDKLPVSGMGFEFGVFYLYTYFDHILVYLFTTREMTQKLFKLVYNAARSIRGMVLAK